MNRLPTPHMSTEARNTQVMTPLILDFCRKLPELPAGSAQERLNLSNQLLVAMHDGHDWSDLHVPYAEREEGVTGRQFAQHLSRAALLDTVLLIVAGSRYMTDLHENDSPNLIMKNSKGLLTAARLPDEKRVELLRGIKHPERSLVKGVDAPILFERSRARLKWSPPVGQWIIENKEPGRGCPAADMIVEGDWGKTSLTHLFWDGMTDVLYPEVVASN